MPRNVHSRPSASKIHPVGLSGRLEAIRAPTTGKAKNSVPPNILPTEKSTSQPLGTCAERARTNRTTLARNMASERLASDQASHQEAARVLILLAPCFDLLRKAATTGRHGRAA